MMVEILGVVVINESYKKVWPSVNLDRVSRKTLPKIKPNFRINRTYLN